MRHLYSMNKRRTAPGTFCFILLPGVLLPQSVPKSTKPIQTMTGKRPSAFTYPSGRSGRLGLAKRLTQPSRSMTWGPLVTGSAYTLIAKALDSNGNPLAPQPALTWSTDAGAAINSQSGSFIASSLGPHVVSVAGASMAGTLTVQVISAPSNTAMMELILYKGCVFDPLIWGPADGTVDLDNQLPMPRSHRDAVISAGRILKHADRAARFLGFSRERPGKDPKREPAKLHLRHESCGSHRDQCRLFLSGRKPEF